MKEFKANIGIEPCRIRLSRPLTEAEANLIHGLATANGPVAYSFFEPSSNDPQLPDNTPGNRCDLLVGPRFQFAVESDPQWHQMLSFIDLADTPANRRKACALIESAGKITVEIRAESGPVDGWMNAGIINHITTATTHRIEFTSARVRFDLLAAFHPSAKSQYACEFPKPEPVVSGA
jgi:hypothetical protein